MYPLYSMAVLLAPHHVLLSTDECGIYDQSKGRLMLTGNPVPRARDQVKIRTFFISKILRTGACCGRYSAMRVTRKRTV